MKLISYRSLAILQYVSLCHSSREGISLSMFLSGKTPDAHDPQESEIQRNTAYHA
jgi:hypothetical protein